MKEDVAAGKPVSHAVRLRQLVSKASGGQEKIQLPARPVNANTKGELMRKNTTGTLTIAGAESADLKSGVKLFTDRDYLSASLPDALKTRTSFPSP